MEQDDTGRQPRALGRLKDQQGQLSAVAGFVTWPSYWLMMSARAPFGVDDALVYHPALYTVNASLVLTSSLIGTRRLRTTR